MKYVYPFLTAACLLGALAGAEPAAAEKRVERQTTLRNGPGPYYDAILMLPRGTAVQPTGATQDSWQMVRSGDSEGWVSALVFQAPRAGLDYGALMQTGGVTTISSVDITAATKGGFAAAGGDKTPARPEVVAGLDQVKPLPELVREIDRSLHGRDAATLLNRLPFRHYSEQNLVFTPDGEAALGRALAAYVLAPGIEAPLPLVQYVNSVAAVVGAKTQRPDLPYRVVILNDDTINGFGLPGGYIVITRGLLRQIHDEGELAAVLGHEMAHIALYHGLREFNRRAVHRVRDATFKELDQEVEKNYAGQDRTQTAAVEADLTDMANQAYLTIIGGRARTDELEADLYGVAYAAAAGYPPDAMITLLRRIKSSGAGDADSFQHHPPLDERIEQLKHAVDKYRLASRGQKLFAERYAEKAAGQLGTERKQ